MNRWLGRDFSAQLGYQTGKRFPKFRHSVLTVSPKAFDGTAVSYAGDIVTINTSSSTSQTLYISQLISSTDSISKP